MIMTEEEMDEQIELMQEETISDFDMVESLNDRCANSECPSHNICDLCMYEMGRADAIEEFTDALINPNNYERYDFDECLSDSNKANDFCKYVFAIAEQIKEQKNG